MKMYEYCGECNAYLGNSVWGLFHCPHCDHPLAIAKQPINEYEEDNDE